MTPRGLPCGAGEVRGNKLELRSDGWTCACGWWNVDCNHCRKCGASLRELLEQSKTKGLTVPGTAARGGAGR